jgi:hypothetical protein
MNGDSEKQDELMCTTDCLEAVGAFKAMKNFLFVIIAICLLLLQTTFWLVELDFVDMGQDEKTADILSPGESTEVASAPIIELAAAYGADEAKAGPDQTESPEEEIISAARRATREIRGDEVEDEMMKQEKLPAEPASEVGAPVRQTRSFRIKFTYISWLIKFCNFTLIITAVLYCLVLMFILKLSLLGRLGGINHISRAFFLSLFMLAFMLPWPRVFDGVIVGWIFTPAELLEAYNGRADRDNIILDALFYCRYMLLWLIVLLLAAFSQARTFRWAKATLKRLEII